MICPNCGNSIPEGANICINCGAAVSNTNTLATQNDPSKTLGLISMILGIVSILFSCCYGSGFVFAIAGIITGILAMKKAKAVGIKNTMALVGVICSAVALVIFVIWVIFIVIAAIGASTTPYYYY